MKIDIFSHFVPAKYKDALYRLKNKEKISYELNLMEGCSTLFNLDERFRILDQYECRQVLTLISPPLEDIASPDEAAELARIANDGMAEMIQKYPQYFVAAVAALPLNNVEATLDEIDRAVNDLKFKGVLMYTSILGRSIDNDEFLPIYQKMEELKLPIWLHPWRTMKQNDYLDEKDSRHKIWSTFGWPYETSAAMTRLIFSGIRDRFQNIKFITHHAGGMIPFFAERICSGYDLWEKRTTLNPLKNLTKPALSYYRDFYADTAIAGHTAGLMCAREFFGVENLLFGTDMPMDSENGYRLVRDIIASIERMEIPEEDKKKIFEGNARKLLQLPD